MESGKLMVSSKRMNPNLYSSISLGSYNYSTGRGPKIENDLEYRAPIDRILFFSTAEREMLLYRKPSKKSFRDQSGWGRLDV